MGTNLTFTEAGNKKTRVLLVEDNHDLAQLLRINFEFRGFEVLVVSDGPVGISVAQEHRPDVIICDLGLPGEMNGYMFARTLRSHLSLSGIPLLAISGFNGEQDVQDAKEAGFDVFLPKPFKFSELTQLVMAFTHAGLPSTLPSAYSPASAFPAP